MDAEQTGGGRPNTQAGGTEGGDPACWVHLVCPGCGAVVSEGHRKDFRLEAETPSAER